MLPIILSTVDTYGMPEEIKEFASIKEAESYISTLLDALENASGWQACEIETMIDSLKDQISECQAF
jgi:hypothetical protein